MRLSYLAITLILTFKPGTLLAQEVPRVVSICDLFAHLGQSNGQMLETRGVIETWAGSWITGRECATKIKAGALNYDNLIAFVDPKLADKLAFHKVEFEWDPASRNKLRKAAYYAAFSGDRIRATVIGLFETKNPPEALQNPRFPDQYAGFGDQGVAPAQIVIKEVKDIVLEPDPSKPKSAQRK